MICNSFLPWCFDLNDLLEDERATANETAEEKTEAEWLEVVRRKTAARRESTKRRAKRLEVVRQNIAAQIQLKTKCMVRQNTVAQIESRQKASSSPLIYYVMCLTFYLKIFPE